MPTLDACHEEEPELKMDEDMEVNVAKAKARIHAKRCVKILFYGSSKGYFQFKHAYGSCAR